MTIRGLLTSAQSPRSGLRNPTTSARFRKPGAVITAVLLAAAVALVGINAGAPVADAAPASFTVSGRGWGHGVGMSQWGARGRAANRNETYDQILRHYYTGAQVTSGATTSNGVSVLIPGTPTSLSFTTGGTTAIGSLGTVGAGATITVTRSGANLVISGAARGTLSSPLLINLNASGGPVTISGGDSYRYGTLRFDTGTPSGVRVIVGSLTMEQFLYGLGEMPMSWPVEALKAQATAARTYAQRMVTARGGTADWNLNAALDGSYRGTKYETPANYFAVWKQAVDATAGKVITYNGSLIDAVYSASSGGRTTESEIAFVTAVPYLRSVEDPDDLTGNNPNASWSATYSAAELGSWFGVGTMTSIVVSGTVPSSGRMDKTSLTLTGTAGSKVVAGAAFRNTVNGKAGAQRQIKSTMFTVDGSTASGSPPPTAPPTTPPTTPAPPPYRPPTGRITVATTEGRQIIIAGESRDPDGPVFVNVVSTMGRERVTRNYLSTNGKFLSTWSGGPGTRNVCVSVFDNPTGRAVSLGCRDVVVK